MTSIDVDKTKIENAEQPAPPTMPGQAADPMAQQGGAPGAMPNQASQQGSAANIPQGGGNPLVQAFTAQQMSMPSSQAVK